MNRQVLVTGASRGIGREVALALGGAGFDVAVHYNARSDAAEDVAAAIRSGGAGARLLQFDIGDRDAAREAIEADMDAHGAYYGVVCNAGIARDSALGLSAA